MQLESGGELPRGLSCIFTERVLALGRENDQRLITRIESVVVSYQSAARGSVWLGVISDGF